MMVRGNAEHPTACPIPPKVSHGSFVQSLAPVTSSKAADVAIKTAAISPILGSTPTLSLQCNSGYYASHAGGVSISCAVEPDTGEPVWQWTENRFGAAVANTIGTIPY